MSAQLVRRWTAPLNRRRSLDTAWAAPRQASSSSIIPALSRKSSISVQSSPERVKAQYLSCWKRAPKAHFLPRVHSSSPRIKRSQSHRNTPALASTDTARSATRPSFAAVKKTYIGATYHRGDPPTLQRVLAERAGATLQMIDSDHSPFYSARTDLIQILLDHG